MFPIKKPYTIGYRYGQKTFYNAVHIGIDIIVPEMTPVYAPEDGVVNTFFGAQGGQWLSLTTKTGKHRFAHLKQYAVVKGQRVKRGDVIAYTGGKKGAPYSGNSTNPHCHWDYAIGSKFVDPEAYSWDNEDMTCEQQLANANKFDAKERVPQIKRLQAEVQKLTDMVNSPTDGIQALKNKITEQDRILDEKRATIKKLEARLDASWYNS